MGAVPPMPKGFIDPHAPDAKERLERAMSRTYTLESNPGSDGWVRERFEIDPDEEDRDGGHGDDR